MHFARIRTGKITKAGFDAWKDEAVEKRKLAENGRVPKDEYEQLLKI